MKKTIILQSSHYVENSGIVKVLKIYENQQYFYNLWSEKFP